MQVLHAAGSMAGVTPKSYLNLPSTLSALLLPHAINPPISDFVETPEESSAVTSYTAISKTQNIPNGIYVRPRKWYDVRY